MMAAYSSASRRAGQDAASHLPKQHRRELIDIRKNIYRGGLMGRIRITLIAKVLSTIALNHKILYLEIGRNEMSTQAGLLM